MKTPSDSDDPLFEIERTIARRADALARQFGVDRGHALDHWRQAEREVLSGLSRGAEVGASAECLR